MQTPDKTLYLITGFTAAGKTEISLRLAEAWGAEIVNCDSLLFYRGLNIGTAKPSRDELARVRHHLVDILDPTEPYCIDRYIDDARGAIEDIHSRGKPVLVVGGSGFYLQSFLGPVVDRIEISEGLRSSLLEDFDQRPLAEFVEELRSLNPDGLGALDTANPRRVFNALLRCRASGLTLKELRERFEAQPGPFEDYERKVLILGRDKAELDRRVHQRVELMVEQGLIEEVQGLLEAGFEANPSACRSIGYRETVSYLKGGGSLASLVDEIAQDTRHLLKKQRTWFRKHLPAEALFDVASWDGELELPWVDVNPTLSGN